MSTYSFQAMATTTASTKRNPAVDEDGKVGAAATNLTGLKILPPMPVSPETRELYGLESPREVKVTYVADADTDIDEGDVLVVGINEYRVRAVGEWPDDDVGYLELVVEEVKGT